MKLFTAKLTDAERARLEEHRAALGLRSHADVIRRWIEQHPYYGDRVAQIGNLTRPLPPPTATFTPTHWSDTHPNMVIGVDATQRGFKVKSPSVQIGPAPSPPGSRLKAEKGKAK